MKTRKLKIAETIKFNKVKYEKVDGYLSGDHLGVYFRVGNGWRVIHVPTGYLVTKANFLNLKDAQHFAEITRRTFGDLLASPSPSVIRDNLHIPGGTVFEKLRLRLESLNRPITVEDTNEYLTGLVRTDQSQRVRVGGKSLASAGLS